MELAQKLERKPEMDKKDAARLVRSIHPFLGWICCISAVSGTIENGPNEPVSWTAGAPEEEADLLATFWEAVAGFPNDTLWVTFNGKRFDVPYIEARSAAHNIRPTRFDIRNTYPYKHRPHADLAWLWPQYYSLEGLCGLLGVPSPKQEGTDGSHVASLVGDGQLEAVAAYAQRDALATWTCSRTALPLVGT
jgi:predicted PolB exonuclease-like 3'-5' exonuclease